MPITYAETEKAFILYINETELTDELHFDLDHAFARSFRKDYRHIILDLTGAETMNSMFISILMNTFIQLREIDGDMTLVGVSENVHRLLRIVRLHTVFKIHESVDEAIAGIAKEDEEQFQTAAPATVMAHS